MRRVLSVMAIAGGVVVATVAFGYYSFENAFRNWPWTSTTVSTSGSVYGLQIGSAKSEVFAEVDSGLRVGRFSSLESPTADSGDVMDSNKWLVSIAECNCWLELEFSERILRRIKLRRYRGPTL